jgi:hypothetical protein
MLPEHSRNAGIAKAEKALHDLTDAAFLLGIGDKATDILVSLWNKFHPGAPPPLVRHTPPILGKRASDPTRKRKRGWRCNLERIDSPAGQALLQEVLAGVLSHRQAALKLGVHPKTFGNAVRRVRRERQRQQTDGPAEIAFSLSLKSP